METNATTSRETTGRRLSHWNVDCRWNHAAVRNGKPWVSGWISKGFHQTPNRADWIGRPRESCRQKTKKKGGMLTQQEGRFSHIMMQRTQDKEEGQTGGWCSEGHEGKVLLVEPFQKARRAGLLQLRTGDGRTVTARKTVRAHKIG